MARELSARPRQVSNQIEILLNHSSVFRQHNQTEISSWVAVVSQSDRIAGDQPTALLVDLTNYMQDTIAVQTIANVDSSGVVWH